MTEQRESPRYLTCAEVAKLVRKVLKEEFPGQKFYVRSRTYSMGASIDIYWIDGPTTKEVDSAVKPLEGSDFDGSIDLKCHWNHWLLPDGSIELAKGTGTEGSRGFISAVDNPKPHPDAELVSMGADYIFTSRSHSRELLERVAEEVSKETGWDAPEIVNTTWYAGGKSREGAAYFKEDFLHKTPGGSEILARKYKEWLWETSCFEKTESEKPELEIKTTDDGNGALSDKSIRIETEGEWIWVYFGSVPDQTTRDTLKSFGGKFSGKRTGWYFTPANCVDNRKAKSMEELESKLEALVPFVRFPTLG
jgi:hypothetical protein